MLFDRLRELAANATPTFKTYKEAMVWVKQHMKQTPNFTSTPEYRELYPQLKKLAKAEKRVAQEEQKRMHTTVWIEPCDKGFRLRLPLVGGFNPSYLSEPTKGGGGLFGIFGGSTLVLKTEKEALKFAKDNGFTVVKVDPEDRWVKMKAGK